MEDKLSSKSEQALLLSIVYVSSATTIFTDDELISFLQSFRESNKKRHITGFLLYHEGNFIQAIEGPEKEINALVESIEADVRHTGMIMLWKNPIPQREFPQWFMGFRKFSELSPEDQQSFSALLEDSMLYAQFQDHPGALHKILAPFKIASLRQYSL